MKFIVLIWLQISAFSLEDLGAFELICLNNFMIVVIGFVVRGNAILAVGVLAVDAEIEIRLYFRLADLAVRISFHFLGDVKKNVRKNVLSVAAFRAKKVD